jgi:hypothetical protein
MDVLLDGGEIGRSVPRDEREDFLPRCDLAEEEGDLNLAVRSEIDSTRDHPHAEDALSVEAAPPWFGSRKRHQQSHIIAVLFTPKAIVV